MDHRVMRTGSLSLVENMNSLSKNRVYNIGDLIDYKQVKTMK